MTLAARVAGAAARIRRKKSNTIKRIRFELPIRFNICFSFGNWAIRQTVRSSRFTLESEAPPLQASQNFFFLGFIFLGRNEASLLQLLKLL